jgi:hypothetical protein
MNGLTRYLLNYSTESGMLVSYAIKLSMPTLASEKQANNILAIDYLTCKPVDKKFCQYISAYIENVSYQIYSYN